MNIRTKTARTHSGNAENQDQPPQTYANYLYIRYHNSVGDDRLTNGSLPLGTTFWYSPDISFSPSDVGGNPVLGTGITLEAMIHNDGFADAISVFVEFMWFDPSLAIVEANKNTIGSRIVSVAHDGYLSVTCPKQWIPTFANGGHECLVVQCSCPGEGTNGLKHPCNAGLDRHVAQKNVNISPSGTPLNFALRAPNPFPSPAGFSIHLNSMVVSVDLRELNGLSVQAALALIGNGNPGRLPLPDGRKMEFATFDVTNRDFNVRIESIKKMRMKEHHGQVKNPVESIRSVAPAIQFRGKTMGEFNLDGGEMAELHMAIPAQHIDDKQVLVHQITQWNKNTVIGGYTLITLPKGFSQ